MANNLDDITRKMGDDFVAILTAELLAEGKNASGNLIKSLRSEVKHVGEQIQIQIIGEDYLTFVDQGRRAGSFPPVQPLVQWCAIKGIPRSAAWAIATNIYKFGIKPTHVIDKAQQKFLQKDIKYLENAYAEYIENEIKIIFE